MKKHYKERSLDELRDVAEKENCTLEVAGPNCILLDIDDLSVDEFGAAQDNLSADLLIEIWRSKHAEQLEILSDEYTFEIKIKDYWRSRSGGLHIRIEFPNLVIPVQTGIFFQLLLGSDWKRELFAWSEASSYKYPGGDLEILSEEDTRSLFRPKE